MRRSLSLLAGLMLCCTVVRLPAVDSIPESQQAALARKILDDYRGTNAVVTVKKLHVIYFTPADRAPEPHYQERLDAMLEDIRAFYRDGMVRAGFGPETFDLDRDAAGKLIIHLAKGAEPESAYPRPSGARQSGAGDALSRKKIYDTCKPVLDAAGISLDTETVLIICNLADWNGLLRTFSHHSPFMGLADQTSGLCFAVDSVIENAADLSDQSHNLYDGEYGDESLGKFNTIFIGGIAHELGHAFSLPHCGERADERLRGHSLMGMGNHYYREELREEGPGAFLPMASTMKLAARPLFSKIDQAGAQKPALVRSELQLSTNVTRTGLVGRPGALRLDGTVLGTPPVYGVIAYFDTAHDGGYQSPTATAVPDEQGRFAIEISDLATGHNGELRVEYCHVNGGTSVRRRAYRITPENTLDETGPEIINTLAPLVRIINRGDLKAAQVEQGRIEKSTAPELARNIAQKLAATLEPGPKPVPSKVPETINRVFLGDVAWKTATVGWLKPTANRIPANDEVDSPLLDAGKFYATGLFAHAPSRYVFELGGKWKQLRGAAGLHAAKQDGGSVEFILKADDKEIFHSHVIHGANLARYEVDVTGVKTLELIVGDGDDGNSNDWGLWLDPTLSR